ncbi:hypothetical protein MM440_10735 [Arsenicicoccus piscis]|uniref:TOMM leader peptide-binding protein n=1 Tax=Arsenicicoccus piscis TaxID=673954 RepID=A0ABQ6HJ42_9MICO|nr:hypothetical protein [Arsenicicoccus piscis]MCH8628240.1 hypothetical protein [Arsenicicoccus piscis]GMA18490.1 hypothetical protein GCM10025862_05110 [Arsenicicoccus piscis]
MSTPHVPPSPQPRLAGRLVRRSATSIQIGLGPRAVVVDEIDDLDLALLTALAAESTVAELDEICHARQQPSTRVAALLTLLGRADVLHWVDRPAHRPQEAHDGHCRPWLTSEQARRRAEQLDLLVIGRGPLPSAIAQQLATALPRADVRHHLELEAVEPLASRARRVVVLTADGAIDPHQASRVDWRVDPLLPVVARDGGVVVGPLHHGVAGPCPRCLDLARRDRDPAWPRLLAQLAQVLPDGGHRPVGADAVATSLAGVVCAAVLDGPLVADGLSLELGGPVPHILHRHWSRHPACPAHETSVAVAG